MVGGGERREALPTRSTGMTKRSRQRRTACWATHFDFHLGHLQVVLHGGQVLAVALDQVLQLGLVGLAHLRFPPGLQRRHLQRQSARQNHSITIINVFFKVKTQQLLA